MLIIRVTGRLPDDFPALLAAARDEGVGNMTLLANQWADGSQRFDDPGALFAGYLGGALAGVGGVTSQPGLAEPAMRMRRLYVAPPFRRTGVAWTLAGAMIQQGLQAAHLLTANAQASPAAAPFWEAMGFEPAQADTHTHQFRG